MKLVDVLDSKSCVGNHVPVRVRPSANKKDLARGLFYCVIFLIYKHSSGMIASQSLGSSLSTELTFSQFRFGRVAFGK